MFFYLSFLRPPPLQAPPHGTILITPQISNDLRTEPFEGSQDLYYSWALESSVQPAQPNAHATSENITKSIKLTTWRPSSAYKEIPVQVPPNVRDGQRWRLILTGHPHAFGRPIPESIDLRRPSIGDLPFSVRSMPVLFSARGAKNTGKQEMIERMYMVPFQAESVGDAESGNRIDASLTFREKTSYDLDKKIWDSGIGLSTWLCELKENAALRSENSAVLALRSTLFSERTCRIVELGAGIGIVSVVLAALRSGISCPTSEEETVSTILTTDVSSAMPLLRENISRNGQFYSSVTPRALILDWDDEDLPAAVKDLCGIDIIVMADVLYNTASFQALARTLSRLVQISSHPPQILLGYKERDEAERSFWDLAAQIGIKFERVGERMGAGGAPVEIWIGNIYK